MSAPGQPLHGGPELDSASRAVEQAPMALAEKRSRFRERLETLKHLAGYLPEVRIARAIAAWVKRQPPADGEPRPEPTPPQGR